MKWNSLLAVLTVGVGAALHAAEIKESTFTQVVNDVNVVSAATRAAQPALTNALVKAPDLVRTGAKSRAELQAPDRTLTRLGANTVFSFEPAGRNLKLEQGSVLFHSPAGKGGGTIKTGGASAAVLGTTLIIACTPDGGFKAIVLEGRGRVTLPNGRTRTLRAGEMTFVLPGSKNFGPVVKINLGKLVMASNLVQGFLHPLPSLPKILKAIEKQNEEIATGRVQDTGYLVAGSASQNDVKVLDPALVDTVFPPFRDTTITTPNLDPSFLSQGKLAYGNGALPLDTYKGFIGNNVTVAAPAIDLGPYGTPPVPGIVPTFDILASGTLSFLNDTTFLSPVARPQAGQVPVPLNLRLVAGQIRIADKGLAGRTTIDYDNAGSFQMISGESVSFNNVNLQNLDGAFSLESKSGSVALGGFNVTASGITLRAADQMTLLNGALSANDGTSAAFIALQARTLNLQDVDFNAKTVSLSSQTGLLAPKPNTGAASLPGYINFINNVTYQKVPAERAVRSPSNPNGPIILSPPPRSLHHQDARRR
jgi:hypothetical protein